jgi:hypothetical protein
LRALSLSPRKRINCKKIDQSHNLGTVYNVRGSMTSNEKASDKVGEVCAERRRGEESVTPNVNDIKEKNRKQEIHDRHELKKASQIMIKQYAQSIQNGKPLGKVLWKKVEYS